MSQVKGGHRPRTSPEVEAPSSRGRRGEGQPAAVCSGRAGPGAEQEQTQASWCGPGAVLPITCLPGLQRKTCEKRGDGEKGEKEREIRAYVGTTVHSLSRALMERCLRVRLFWRCPELGA